MNGQGHLFDSAQLGLGLEDTRRDPTRVDPAGVREELTAILAAARDARDAAPWDRRTQRYHRVVFPQMARWLPDDEAAALCAAFGVELDRIELLLPA